MTLYVSTDIDVKIERPLFPGGFWGTEPPQQQQGVRFPPEKVRSLTLEDQILTFRRSFPRPTGNIMLTVFQLNSCYDQIIQKYQITIKLKQIRNHTHFSTQRRNAQPVRILNTSEQNGESQTLLGDTSIITHF